MLDKRSFALLGVINERCLGSGYVIFSADELVELMPKSLKLEREGLKESINALSAREYISVKYQDDNELCLRPLIKGRVVMENNSDKAQAEIKAERRYAFFAFLGGLLGGILSGIIIYAVKLLGGV